ncbi:MAG TPA: hypothetical protein VLZ50_08175 [Terracidiphilus sp.]|nr:hypothetical protein [Terracidiphilus sp.]
MYCSGCGQALAPGEGFCHQCGRPVAQPVPPVPGMMYQIQTYASKVKTLAVFWLVYAGLNLVLGFVGVAFLHAFWGNNHWGNWDRSPWNGPWGGPFSPWFGPALIHFAWIAILVRVGLALAAGWGLMERAQWGRFVALVAAFLNILHFPFGTALAIFTLVLLLGYRNNALYNELIRTP